MSARWRPTAPRGAVGNGRRRGPHRPTRQRVRRDPHTHVDVPTAVLSGLGICGGDVMGFLVGTTTPFDAPKLAALYPSRSEYLARFDAAIDTAVAAGFLLPADSDEIKSIAAQNSAL